MVDDSDNKPILHEDVPDNQLMLFSIADDILENHVVVKREGGFKTLMQQGQ